MISFLSRLRGGHRYLSAMFNLALILFFQSTSRGEDWRQFRGTDSTAASRDAAPPAEFDLSTGKNIAWEAGLPGRGLSSPIIVGNRVFLTASSGPRQDRLHMLCFDNATGKTLWERRLWATGRSMTHPTTCNAAPSPASDGERIVGFYSSNDVVCYNLDGELQWARGLTYDYPNASNSLGMASSLVIVDGVVIALVENDSESFTIGLSTRTGETVWKLDRPRKANWTSPLVMQDGKTVLLQSSRGVDMIEGNTGRVLWSFTEGAATIPSSARDGEIMYIPTNGLAAMKVAEKGQDPISLWQTNRLRPGTATPLAYRGRIYCVTSAGVLLCANAKDGKILWQMRLEGPFSASPIAAGDSIYLVNEPGKCFVVEAGGTKGEKLGESELGESVLATPSLANGALYVRSDEHLWKIAAPASRAQANTTQ